jgi:hypothetical protein
MEDFLMDEKHPHYVVRAMGRLRSGKLLIKQVSSAEEAVIKGDGHLFFTHPDGKPFGTASAIYCIKNHLVEPVGDGLFSEDSQTYRAAS